MKKKPFVSRGSFGFTLIELLVVISIIGVLAGLLLPVLSNAKKSGQIAKAKMEVAGLVTAIKQFQNDYSRLPSSKLAQKNRTLTSPDQTYGTVPVNMHPQAIPVPPGMEVAHNDGAYNANNSELMLILLDIDPATGAQGHPENPKHINYLDGVNRVNTPISGIGPDFVYRDPWKMPYIITLDLSYDNQCRDAFYRWQQVSGIPNQPSRGLNGLSSKPREGTYELSGSVMVWSFGPDQAINVRAKATDGANKDNVLSWQ